MSDTPAAVLDRFIAAFRAGDVEGVCALLHPEVMLHEAAGLPYEGDYKGPDGFLTLLGAISGSYDIEILDAECLPVDDERIVARMPARFTSKISANTAEFPVVELYTIRGGLICDVDIYYKDPGAVAALHGTAH